VRVSPKTALAFIVAIAALVICIGAGVFSGGLLLGQRAAEAVPTAGEAQVVPITGTPTIAEATPTAQPSAQPTSQPTNQPTTLPTNQPTNPPAGTPTSAPSEPTTQPTKPPPPSPTRAPVAQTVYNWKGNVPPAPGPIALPMGSPEYGMQAFMWWRQDTLDRDISLIKNSGFGWIKQNFGWRDIEATKGQYDWHRSDRIVLSMNEAGLDMIVRLDYQPDWARSGCSLQGPPTNLQDYANFVSAVATRYRGRIRAYEIWNEPNLAREWCDQPPSGAAYTQLLRVAYTAIKAADPTAWVVTAGLSPTTRNDDVAKPDIYFLQEMYDAGAAKYFDLLGAHGAGFRAPPEADPGAVAKDPNLANPGDFSSGVPEELRRVYCFRHVEDLHAIMIKNGDSKKQVALLEFGWTNDPRPNSPYAWHAIASEEVKADYFARAYAYAYSHWSPWIGLMSLIYVSDPSWTPNDEQYWWAITNPDGSPRAAYNRLKSMDRPIH
jgi:hypothetical protein